MIEAPAFEHPRVEGKSCVRLEDGQYRAYLNRNAVVELLYGLHWFATDQPPGEEVDIWSRNCEELPGKGKRIGLCELNLVPAHTHKKQGKRILKQAESLRHKPHGVYAEEHDRLDYHISAEEARTAYETLTTFLTENEDHIRRREVTLFGTLAIRLVTP